MSNIPDSEYDVIVLGTGAAGLTAALSARVAGATVGLFEKAETVGGTTAVSGGVVWVPFHNLTQTGEPLTREAARGYFDSISLGYIDDELIDSFIDSGQSMIDFIQANTSIQFSVAEGFPDYYSEQPGARPRGGRSLDPSPFSFTELGEWADKVTRFPRDDFAIGFDYETKSRRLTSAGSPDEKLLRENDVRFLGAGLVGGLLKSLVEHGIEPFTSYRAVDITAEDGVVTGVTFEHGGERVSVRSSQVIIATGGFEWDSALVKSFLRGPMRGAVSPPFNEGDGLRMAIKLGAELGNMGDAWWTPVIHLPGDTWKSQVRTRAIRSERSRPRSIMVNRKGKRFANEALNYNSLGLAFHAFDPSTLSYTNLPAWLIVDDVHIRKYGFLGFTGEGDAPEWLHRSETIDELSEKTGIDADGLKQTLARWNSDVATGRDSEFARSESAHDAWWGDWDGATAADKTLGPIDSAPYYAVEMSVGALGTKGGPCVTADGQVLHVDGHTIPGLFAIGNAAAAVTGQAYGGAGGTIGPAMVGGFRAGLRAALELRDIDAEDIADAEELTKNAVPESALSSLARDSSIS